MSRAPREKSPRVDFLRGFRGDLFIIQKMCKLKTTEMKPSEVLPAKDGSRNLKDINLQFYL